MNRLQQVGSSLLELLCLVWLSSAQRSAGITGNLFMFLLREAEIVDLETTAQRARTQHYISVSVSYRLCVSEVGGLSMAAAGELRSPVSCTSLPDDSMEPYTTERLSRLPGGYKALTEPFTALTIDFNNVQVSRITPNFHFVSVCCPQSSRIM